VQAYQSFLISLRHGVRPGRLTAGGAHNQSSPSSWVAKTSLKKEMIQQGADIF
jgi:hypothetical protein